MMEQSCLPDRETRNTLADPFLVRQAEFLEAGRKGETWVADREWEKLANTPYTACLDTGFSQRSSCFDIKSSTLSGQPLYIEVKSTGGNADSPFYMTLSEYAFAAHCLRHGIPYELHRVYHVFDDWLRGEIIYSAEDILRDFECIPVSYRLVRKCERNTASHDLTWEDCAERIPGTRCRFYLAKIVGAHQKYCFDRQFQRGKYEYEADRIWLSCTIESTGVYEMTILWLNEAGFVLQRQRRWFLLVDGRTYDLKKKDVLAAVNFLHQKGGAAA